MPAASPAPPPPAGTSPTTSSTPPSAPGPAGSGAPTAPASPGTAAARPTPAAAVIQPPLNYQGQLPSFEVASVKKAPPTNGLNLRMALGQGGRANLTLSLRQLIQLAWNAKDFQVVGGPGWMANDRFAIVAKAETDVPRDQVYLMLRALIIERFKLKSHIESRQVNTYVLTRPSPDSPLGAGLKQVDCSAPRTATTTAAALLALERGGAVPCGSLMSSASGGIRAGGLTMASFASLLSSLMNTTVIDKTGMTGTYSFTADFVLSSRNLQASAPGESMPTLVESGTSVFSAIKEMGLRLERRREAVDVLVIDSIEQPDED